VARYVSVLRLIRAIRRIVRANEPDIVIAVLAKASLIVPVATAGLGVRVIGHEMTYFPAVRGHAHIRILKRLLYRHLYALVVQTERLRVAAEPIAGRRVVVIPGHVTPLAISEDVGVPSAWDAVPGGRPNIRIVGVGRLSHLKGFDVLLRALGLVSKSKGWGLIVLGEGEDRVLLEQLATELGIDERIWFPGWSRKPGPTLRDSTVFVLPSRLEGWGLALLEAMAQGLPVVAADCPAGPAEMIRQEVNGLLVPPDDPQALAAAIERLIEDPMLRERLAEAATAVRDTYSIERVAAKWERLFLDK
jgi:glycosyltransferase involved in cell wall biosynthesis